MRRLLETGHGHDIYLRLGMTHLIEARHDAPSGGRT
jgi:hypothetical protein